MPRRLCDAAGTENPSAIRWFVALDAYRSSDGTENTCFLYLQYVYFLLYFFTRDPPMSRRRHNPTSLDAIAILIGAILGVIVLIVGGIYRHFSR